MGQRMPGKLGEAGWSSGSQLERVGAAWLAAASSEPKRLVKLRRRLAIRSEAKLIECAAGRLDDGGDEQAADTLAAELGSDVEVADPADSPDTFVRVRVEAADTDDAAAERRGEEGLAGLSEAIGPTLPVIDQAAQEPEAGRLALGNQVGELVGG